jgi:hypothetical protein
MLEGEGKEQLTAPFHIDGISTIAAFLDFLLAVEIGDPLREFFSSLSSAIHLLLVVPASSWRPLRSALRPEPHLTGFPK